jgi:hypothetical protein
MYRDRVQYTMPHTPQLVLGSEDPHYIELFVQDAPHKLNKIINKNTSKIEVYLLLKSIIQTLLYLVKKCGFFWVNESMIRVTHN